MRKNASLHFEGCRRLADLLRLCEGSTYWLQKYIDIESHLSMSGLAAKSNTFAA